MAKIIKSLNWIRSLTIGTAVLALIIVAGCSGEDDGDTDTTPLQGLASCSAQAGAAVICGKVLAADGVTPVVGAEIAMTGSSALVLQGLHHDGFGALEANESACETDDVGDFACLAEECSGSQSFLIISGSFSSKQFTAECNAGEVTNVPESETTVTGDASVKWLVVPGVFDGIQLLLAQLKGCTLTGDTSIPAGLRGSTDCEEKGLTVLDTADVVDFLSTENLNEFQAVFANCASDFSFDADVTSALQDYVDNGGNMYFSDLSDSWLTAVFPGLITFPANKNDTSAGTLTGVSVVDTGLQVFLGSAGSPQTTMDIEFDLGVWTAMESVIAGWTTFIEGDVSPLAPTLPGTRPITVGGPQEDGCVFYTSYHVEGGSIGADQETALRYLVLNRMNNCS